MIQKQIYNLFFIFFLIFSLNSVIYAEEEAPTPQTQEVQEPQTQTNFIKVSDIPQEAAKALIEIKKLSDTLAKDEEITKIDNKLKRYVEDIDRTLNDPVNQYLQYVSLRNLQKEESQCNVYTNQLTTWNSLIKEKIEIFDKERKILEDFLIKWKNTEENAHKEEAPEAILKHVSSVIEDIQKLMDYAKNRYDSLLTTSNLITIKLLAISELDKKIKSTIEETSSNLLHKNSFSLIELLQNQTFSPVEYFVSVYNSITEKMSEFIAYYKNKNIHELFMFTFFSVLIVIFVTTFNYLYKKERLFILESSYDKKEYHFIGLPISTSIILILLIDAFMFKDIPSSAKDFQLLMLFFPIFRIFQTLISKKALKHFYIFFILYFLSIVERNASGYELDNRFFSLGLSIAFVVFIYYMIKEKLFDDFIKPSLQKYAYKALMIAIVFLCISFAADIYGATLLASKITNSIFISLYASIIFYVLSIVLSAYITILLRRRILSASNMLEQFSQNIEKTSIFFIKIAMTIWWLIVLTETIGINSYLVDVKNSFLSLSWAVGTITISVQSIFDFIIIIFGTWFLAKLTKIILEVEVFARFKLPRGFPTAISTISNYIIVISGIILALSSLGISSDQFALVFGALGVGIGFGMRNIVANFISGIIMVFERPVQLGDTIEINNTMGEVQSIGTRSSTIKTFDGSEVIIPNADFIAKEITNWTLSDERRRKTLTFKVAQESDIQEVLKIMDDVASSHPNVLQEPKPMATFIGFGEYFLEFKLYFWLHENIIMAQSEINVNIYEKLQKAGIKMPLPKQEFKKV